MHGAPQQKRGRNLPLQRAGSGRRNGFPAYYHPLYSMPWNATLERQVEAVQCVIKGTRAVCYFILDSRGQAHRHCRARQTIMIAVITQLTSGRQAIDGLLAAPGNFTRVTFRYAYITTCTPGYFGSSCTDASADASADVHDVVMILPDGEVLKVEHPLRM